MGHSVLFIWYRIGKKSGSTKNCGRWSDILDEMFPEIQFWPMDNVYYRICGQ